jgi:enoyl-CoA hydratase/carnithine racemase
MTFKTILFEKKNGYALVTLNRPMELNALSGEMRSDLENCFILLEADRDVNVVVLTGGDYVFSAGMDLKEMAAIPDEEIRPYFSSIFRMLKKIYSFPKPVIAAAGGVALGGGFNLLTVCDLIIASESAIFGHPELRFGLNPLFDPLRRIVGMAKAKELTMLGEPIGAKEALRIGLVNRVVSPEKLMSDAEATASELARRSPETITYVKKMASIVPNLDKYSALELECDTEALLFSGAERKKLMSEFMESLKNRKRRNAGTF